MIAAVLLAAAALPLGAWPQETGPPASVVEDVEFYLVEPEDDYSIIAVQALATPLKKAEPEAVKRLAALANRLGADAVLLLRETTESSIPDDTDKPLPTTGRYAFAVFLAFDQEEGWEQKPAVPSAWSPGSSAAQSRARQARPHGARAGLVLTHRLVRDVRARERPLGR
jgi:hypothetical protein